MAEEDKLNFLIENRKYVRTKATKLCNSVEANLNELETCACQHHILKLNNIRDTLSNYNSEISGILWAHTKDRKQIDGELDSCEHYEDIISVAIHSIQSKLECDKVVFNVNSHNSGSKLKLPQIPLPKYGNKFNESFVQFINNFETVISKYSLSDYEKFIFLQDQLSNEPLTIINSLQGSKRSYQVAKDLLEKAFAAPLLQKFDIIRRLTKLSLGSHGDPYKYVGEMRIIIDTFDSLQIDTNDILQFFIWHSMPESLRTQFIHITNVTNPNLAEIEENIFTAIDRIGSWKKSSDNYDIDTAHSYAANVHMSENNNETKNNYGKDSKKESVKRFKPCVLCSTENNSANHPLYKCSEYTDAKSKTDKLRSINLCTKCSNNHLTKECKFTFKMQCSNCKGFHFSCLCLTKKKKHNDVESSRETVNGSTVTIVTDNKHSASHVCTSSVLPTLSCKVKSGRLIRLLKDTGAQNNFVTKQIATRENFEVLKKVHVTISGVNSDVNYESDVVSVDLCLGAEKIKVTAIVLPEIKTKLNLRGLSLVVTKFIKKGFKLADQFLFNYQKDHIDNVDFILGATSMHVLSGKSVTFGRNNDSMYFDTRFGAIMVGRLDVMYRNLDYFPDRICEEQNINCSSNIIRSSNYKDLSSNDTSNCANTNELMNISKIEDNWNSIPDNLEHFYNTCINLCITDSDGNVVVSDLNEALNNQILNSQDDLLEEKCTKLLNYDTIEECREFTSVDEELVNEVLTKARRDESGRLLLPIMWNKKVEPFLANNYMLAKKILLGNLSKLKNSDHLRMIDDVFRDQLERGVIEKIPNLEEFLNEQPNYSFIAHMPVIKLNRETTKCRVVLLSNIGEKINNGRNAFNHNQAMQAGPTLNRKITTALLQLRFDEKLLLYDLEKAFLTIGLFSEDQDRLCFLWFNDVSREDFTVIGYKSTRLPFGLRCSPSLLMLGLYKILMLDSSGDCEELKNLKKSMYNLLYMDNGGVSTHNSVELVECFDKLESIFSPYKFKLQQFISNDKHLNKIIENKYSTKIEARSKILGLVWDIENDTLLTAKLTLDDAASTKRNVLKSIASNFDLFNFHGPIINRARLFMHLLQLQEGLGWDEELSQSQLNNWRNICRQVNSAEPIPIKRFVGRRDHKYQIVGFSDSSRLMYGTVIYLYNENERKLNFILAKSKVVNKSLKNKSIPTLEMTAIALAAENAIDMYKELSGNKCVSPINITNIKIFTDSLVSLYWLQSSMDKMDKMSKVSVFVKNKLNHILELSEIHSVKFCFCSGKENPADYISRPTSYGILMKSNYFTGISSDIIDDPESMGLQTISVPNQSLVSVINHSVVREINSHFTPILNIEKYSSFSKILKIYRNVILFVNNLKRKLIVNNPNGNFSFSVLQMDQITRDSYQLSIKTDQLLHFPELVTYFANSSRRYTLKDVPPLVKQLNVFCDEVGVLRVKSKMNTFAIGEFPVLLSKNSKLCELIIMEIHEKMSHSGLYTILSEFRKKVYVPRVYSTVKKIIKNCTTCKRFNSRVVNLNQSPYRDFRISPPSIPFKYIFLDHIGPFNIKNNNSKEKVYLLCITCLWSRAVNLLLCVDLSTENFLRSLQIHTFEHGIPELCLSDMGSQIISGGNIISDILKKKKIQSYLEEMDIKTTRFEQYPKGVSKLGGLVEAMVKQVKKLVFGTIKNNILSYLEFEFLIKHVNHIINKRPIAFTNALRDDSLDNDIPSAITPEILVRGRDLDSVTIIPMIESEELNDPSFKIEKDPIDHIINSFKTITTVREKLVQLYQEEFLSTLMHQATNEKDRFKLVKHTAIKKGDIVLLKDAMIKPCNYALGKVLETFVNVLGETTSVIVIKGKTKEKVKRHVSTLIPFVTNKETEVENVDTESGELNDFNYSQNEAIMNKRMPRISAVKSKMNTKELYQRGLT